MIGLSKVARLVEVFARRLRVQERLTVEIADTIQKTIQPLGVGVVIARHLCMMMRALRSNIQPPRKTQSKNSRKSKTRASQTPTAGSPHQLAGTVAVVTGGSRGIGYATALLLGSNGASVVITGRDEKTLGRALAKSRWRSGNVFSPLAAHPRVVAQVCDVRDPESVAALFAAVKREFGAIDILVNNAGVTQPMLSAEETGIELWNEIIATDLTGVFLFTRAALPLMRMGGTIINNISAAAKQVFPKFAAYTAAKHCVLGFTLGADVSRSPSRFGERSPVRVVAFMPGGTSTNLWDHLWPQAPRERMIDPTTVAEAILFAVSLPPQANLSEFLVVPTSGAL